MRPAVCVYSSSSDALDTVFFEAAETLGAQLGANGYDLVFGGTRLGLMGTVARAVHANGGKVIGVIPQAIHERGIAYEESDELIVTHDLRERKAIMEARADAFIGLPGGFGTLEELFEILTLKQLGVHDRPIVLVDVNGFYAPLVTLLEHIYENRFAKPITRELYAVVPDANSVCAYLASYRPPELHSKWF